MIERFETSMGVIGFDSTAYLSVDRYPDIVEGFCPVAHGITAIQNPVRFSELYRRARLGDASTVGENDGMNDVGLEITATGVHAEINVGADTYEQELTFAEFEPILEVWERAWAAAQAYKRALA